MLFLFVFISVFHKNIVYFLITVIKGLTWSMCRQFCIMMTETLHDE